MCVCECECLCVCDDIGMLQFYYQCKPPKRDRNEIIDIRRHVWNILLIYVVLAEVQLRDQ